MAVGCFGISVTGRRALISWHHVGYSKWSQCRHVGYNASQIIVKAFLFESRDGLDTRVMLDWRKG